MAAELGISFASVARIWRHWGIHPRRIETFRFATDPPLAPRIRDVVGLYLNPPDSAVVISVEETFQARAVGQARRLRRGVPEWRTRDHKRYGTGTLFAALQAATGKNKAAASHPRHKELLRFLRTVSAAHRGVELHVMVDNYGACKHPEVRRWLNQAENQQVTAHVTTTERSWLSIVEVLIGMVAHQAGRTGTFRSARELSGAISAFTQASMNHRQIFAWVKNAPEFPGEGQIAVRPLKD